MEISKGEIKDYENYSLYTGFSGAIISPRLTEVGIASKDLIHGSLLNLNFSGSAELGLGYLNTNRISPYANLEGAGRFGVNFSGKDSNTLVPSPFGVTRLGGDGVELYGELRAVN